MKQEIWKDIKEYEGLYQVSSLCNYLAGKSSHAGGFHWKRG